MPRCRSTRRCSGFTLLELLLVSSIIALLIAILLPVLGKVRRRALVLACPIAYLGEDGQVHLTDLDGKSGPSLIQAFPQGSYETRYCTGIAWSPSGQKLATYMDLPGQPLRYCILDPASGSQWLHNTSGNGWGVPILFAGWFNDAYFFESSISTIYLRDAQTGQIWKQIPKNTLGGAYFNLSTLPITAGIPGLAIANMAGTPVGGIYVVKEGSLPGKPIWRETQAVCNWPPRVDPTGEWIGWTRSYTNLYWPPACVAIKRLHDPPSTPPTLLGTEFNECNFCDWTEDGKILVAIYDAKFWGLAVMDRTGKILRKIPVPIAHISLPASYRKYGHQ